MIFLQSNSNSSSWNVSEKPSVSAATLVPARCCSFPFSLNGIINYSCVKATPNDSEVGCYLSGRKWVTCMQPAGKQTQLTFGAKSLLFVLTLRDQISSIQQTSVEHKISFRLIDLAFVMPSHCYVL